MNPLLSPKFSPWGWAALFVLEKVFILSARLELSPILYTTILTMLKLPVVYLELLVQLPLDPFRHMN